MSPFSAGVAGIVLAGGESRRMGRDKAFLPWGEATLIEHVLATLRPLMDELIVVVKDAAAFRHLGVRVVEDLVPDAHALGGLYTGLTLASHERCFVCGCDAPFLNPALIRFLIEQADGCDAVIPQTSDGLQPLHAVYRASCAVLLEEPLRNRQWELSGVARRLRARIINASVLIPLDPSGASFFNINTPEELAQALGRLQAVEP